MRISLFLKWMWSLYISDINACRDLDLIVLISEKWVCISISFISEKSMRLDIFYYYASFVFVIISDYYAA